MTRDGAGAEVALAGDDRIRERRRALEGLKVGSAAALGRAARPRAGLRAVFRKPSLMCQPIGSRLPGPNSCVPNATRPASSRYDRISAAVGWRPSSLIGSFGTLAPE